MVTEPAPPPLYRSEAFVEDLEPDNLTHTVLRAERASGWSLRSVLALARSGRRPSDELEVRGFAPSPAAGG